MLKQERILRIQWLLLGLAVIMLAAMWITNEVASAEDPPPSRSTSVFYQVTYTNKDIKNLPEAPTTNKGILMVTRITRTKSTLPSYETISTGNTPIENYNPVRTASTELKWDGRAWVDKIKLPPRKTASQPAGNAQQTAEFQKKLNAAVRDVQNTTEAVNDAQKQLDAAKTDEEKAEAKSLLHASKEAQKYAMARLAALKAPAAPAAPTAQPAAPAPAAPTGAASTGKSGYPPQSPVLRTAVNVNGGGLVDFWHRGLAEPFWPFYGNVSAYSEQPNPDYDTGPRVIVREEE